MLMECLFDSGDGDDDRDRHTLGIDCESSMNSVCYLDYFIQSLEQLPTVTAIKIPL